MNDDGGLMLDAAAKPSWSYAARAFGSRNFRIYFPAMAVSYVGWWMLAAAMNWLVYRLTDSPLMLGLVSFVALLPAGVFSLVGGVLADAVPSRRLMFYAQLSLFLLSAGFVALAATDLIQAWHILVLAFGLRTANVVGASARFALLRDSVPKDDLTSAIGLNGSMNNVARAIGPALSGLVIASVGEVGSIFFYMLACVAVMLSLWAMRLPSTRRPTRSVHVSGDLADGLKYTWRDQLLRGLFGLMMISGLLLEPFVLMLAVFARDTLNVGPEGYGFLMGAFGLGAAVGALAVAYLREGNRGRWLILASLTFPIFLVLFALSPTFSLSAACLALMGVGLLAQRTLTNSLLQLNSEEEYQGRVVGLFILTGAGAPRLGAVVIGAAIQYGSIAGTVVASTVIGLALLLYAIWRLPVVRRLP